MLVVLEEMHAKVQRSPALIAIESASGTAASKDGAALGAEGSSEVLCASSASGAGLEEFMSAAHAELNASSGAAAAATAAAVGPCMRQIARVIFARAVIAGANEVQVDAPADGGACACKSRGARMSTTASAGGGACVI